MKFQKICLKVLIVVTLFNMNTMWGQNGQQIENFSLLQENINKNNISPGKGKQEKYLNLMKDNLNNSEIEKLKVVNDFINKNIEYKTDADAWGKLDYWSAPLELLNNGAGDCEDFAIAKYYGLKKIGIDIDKLRLVYVKYQSYKEDIIQAHMVLSYKTKNKEILILDNLVSEIKTSEQRKDLTPVFSFNDAGIYNQINGDKLKNTISKWNEVIEKAKKEGW